MKNYVFWFYLSPIALESALALSQRNGLSSRLLNHQSSCLFATNASEDENTGNGSLADGFKKRDISDFLLQPPKVSQPNKSDLYADEELAGLLHIHQQLQSAMVPPAESSPATQESLPNDVFGGGLHDLILQTVENIEDEAKAGASWISDEIQEKISRLTITAIASDVDGTIIGSDQMVHPRTIKGILSAQKSPKLDWVLPATGKTRWGARNSLGPELAELTEGPGVYNQGLYCLGKNGEVVFEKKLSASSLEAAEKLVTTAGVAIVAYDGDDLYTTDLSRVEVVELHEKWGEPASKEISSLRDHKPGIHKVLLMDSDAEKLKNEVRPELERMAAENDSVVTQAIPTMLELLPSGCSKALGVEKVCEHLGIDPGTQLLSLGDAENDVGMLEISAIGVAVGNAGSDAKNAADVVLPITSTEGGVGMAIEDILDKFDFVIFKRQEEMLGEEII